ncbi:uncharacterized protein LOC141753866 [Sebastes fasciatus]|uniref:uncharacterized protein LOC141753866 n=1 Tax=Sebastes fasciatus TaxID=394691 RepID=UPI003D9E97E4
MSKVDLLRVFVKQRLTLAAEEILDLFETTIAEYEEQLEFSSKENQRRQKLLDAVLHPEVQLHRADVQQLLVVREEVPTEQQEWSLRLDQEDPEPPHIKEEQEELWTSQEGEQLQWLQEADIKFPFTSVHVKGEEDDEEKPQFSQLHERQSEENREAEHLITEADGGSEPARISDPDSPLQPATHHNTSPSFEPETDDNSYWEETKEPQSGSNPLQNNEVSVSDMECNPGKTFSCSVCKTGFSCSNLLVRHMRSHTEDKPFSCSDCGKRFRLKYSLKQHLTVHTGEKPFSCSICGKRFAFKGDLRRHLTVHTGEKPFCCSICGKRFAQKEHMKRHLMVHTGEKPIACSVCNKRFTLLHNAKKHKCVGESSKTK